jgi:hypothetical protein
MRVIFKIVIVIFFLFTGGQAAGQYFASTIKDMWDLNGCPFCIKLKTGEEVYGASWSMAWGKYRINTKEGVKKNYRPDEISTISFDLSKGDYEFALVSHSLNSPFPDMEPVVKDTIIFENIEGKGLLQWLNPGFSKKLKVYAFDVKDPDGINPVGYGFGEDIGYLKYLMRKEDGDFIITVNNYKEGLDKVFEDCPRLVLRSIFVKSRWSEIERYVFEYDRKCK